jgi:hypothetical protein
MSFHGRDWAPPGMGRAFSTAETAKLAPFPVTTLRTLVQRGYVNVARSHDAMTGGGARGANHRFTWRGVVQTALAAEIIKVTGAGPGPAFHAAALIAFTYRNEPGRPIRQAGLPYPLDRGDTLLLLSGEQEPAIMTERDEAGELLDRCKFNVMVRRSLDTLNFTQINVNEVVRRVVEGADADFAALMADYPHPAAG